MSDLPSEKSMERSTASVQLSLPIRAEGDCAGIATPALQEAEGRWEIVAPEPTI